MQTIQHIYGVINKITQGSIFGNIAVGAASVLTAFYAPITVLLVACFVFTSVDMIYGIKVAKKFNKKIESGKNWKGTITKIIDEFTILSLARLLEYAVLGDASGVFVLTGGCTVIIGLTELWSIIENLNTLNPDGPWRALGKFLKKKGEDYIGTEIDLKYDNGDSNNSKKPATDICDGIGDPTDGMAMDCGES